MQTAYYLVPILDKNTATLRTLILRDEAVAETTKRRAQATGHTVAAIRKVANA